MSYTRRPQWAQVSLRLPRLRRTQRVRWRRVSSIWEWYTRYPGHPSTWVQSVGMSIPVRVTRASSEAARQVPTKEYSALGRRARYPDSRKRVKGGGRHSSRQQRGAASRERAFAVAPFPFSKCAVQNGPEQSRARRFCAAERPLDGEDRSGRWN